MHAQASIRTTQKILQPHELEAVQDPTLRFFLEGEALEAETQRAVAERDAVERRLGFAGRFGNDNAETLIVHRGPSDRPIFADEPLRSTSRRGPLIAFAGLSSLMAIAVAAWMWMTPPVRSAGWWRPATAPAADVIGRSDPTLPPAPPLSRPFEATTAPAPTPVQTAPMVAASTPALSESPSSGASAENAPVAPDDSPSRVSQKRVAAEVEDDNSTAPARREHPARGYVWSPAAKALVPANAAPVSEPSGPTATAPVGTAAGAPIGSTPGATTSAAPRSADPDAVMAPTLVTGPGIAPASTGAAPDETARVPSTEPERFEPPKPSEKSSAPIIE